MCSAVWTVSSEPFGPFETRRGPSARCGAMRSAAVTDATTTTAKRSANSLGAWRAGDWKAPSPRGWFSGDDDRNAFRATVTQPSKRHAPTTRRTSAAPEPGAIAVPVRRRRRRRNNVGDNRLGSRVRAWKKWRQIVAGGGEDSIFSVRTERLGPRQSCAQNAVHQELTTIRRFKLDVYVTRFTDSNLKTQNL